MIQQSRNQEIIMHHVDEVHSCMPLNYGFLLFLKEYPISSLTYCSNESFFVFWSFNFHHPSSFLVRIRKVKGFDMNSYGMNQTQPYFSVVIMISFTDLRVLHFLYFLIALHGNSSHSHFMVYIQKHQCFYM